MDAIANLTMTAYAKASELKLTAEEIAGLQEQFPDDAFRPGAAGKENLIYIEHAHLRDRLNRVLGVGQWAVIPRKRWGEDFTIPAYRDKPAVDACRIYVEAMLMIRGCFVAEAVGDMVYYKNNQSQNYGDAVEGAKTAAFRRCAKELGVGLQAWKKDWCEGWWKRKNASGRNPGSQPTSQRPPAAPSPQSAPKPAAKASDIVPESANPAEADKDQRFRFLASLSSNREVVTKYFVSKGWLKEGQALEDLPNQHVPTTKKVYDSIIAELQAFMDGDQKGEDWWRTFKIPFGNHKDKTLAEVDKKVLYGFWANFEATTTFPNGGAKSDEQIEADNMFRKALDDSGAHYGFGTSNQ